MRECSLQLTPRVMSQRAHAGSVIVSLGLLKKKESKRGLATEATISVRGGISPNRPAPRTPHARLCLSELVFELQCFMGADFESLCFILSTDTVLHSALLLPTISAARLKHLFLVLNIEE